MEIKIADKNDIEILLKLRLENANYHAKIVTKSVLKANAPDFFRSHTMNCMNDENCKIFLAIVDGKPVGYIIGFINQQHPIFDLGKEALIDDFYVKQAFQRNGFGKTLYNNLIDWFYQNGIERINLNVYQNNSKGNSFWNKQDFKIQFYKMSKEMNREG